MAKTTTTKLVAEALEDLGRDDWEKFCFALRDRREEPRIKRRELQGKSVLEVTDLLVSRFTEAGALTVTLDTLRMIDCNQAAETLESKTKAPLDNGHPVLRKRPNGQLEAKLSQEAQQGGSPETTWKKPREEKAEAELSRYAIQVGMYKGRDFKWLLENKVSYVATLVANHQREREHSAIENPQMANKDSLTRYAMAYPEVQKLVSMRKRATSLVGFGKYGTETLQDLYKSKDKLKISYVDFLRNKENCTPGSKMEAAVRYILQRDKELAASGPAKRRTARKRVQRTRSQRTRSSRCLKKPVGSPAGRGRPLKRTQRDRLPR